MGVESPKLFSENKIQLWWWCPSGNLLFVWDVHCTKCTFYIVRNPMTICPLCSVWIQCFVEQNRKHQDTVALNYNCNARLRLNWEGKKGRSNLSSCQHTNTYAHISADLSIHTIHTDRDPYTHIGLVGDRAPLNIVPPGFFHKFKQM